MLRIVNKKIYFARGESVTLEFIIKNNDGSPYVLPPISDKTLQPIVAFTIKTSDNYATVLTKYLDMREGITAAYRDADGNVITIQDTDEFGYSKFTTQDFIPKNDINEVYEFYNTISNRSKICKVGSDYYFWCSTNESSGQVCVYEFALNIVLSPKDTMSLSSGTYLYDLIAYIGEYLPSYDTGEIVSKLPLVSPPVFKQQLMHQNNLILEESNND